MLESVPRPPRLNRRESGERRLLDVVVVAVDIRVGVVRDIVLHTPGVATEAEKRIRRPPDEVVVAAALEVGPMVRVVLDAEGNVCCAGAKTAETPSNRHRIRLRKEENRPGTDDEPHGDR